MIPGDGVEPEDFQVAEEIDLRPDRGPFALYQLTKQSLGTLEAIDATAQRWNLSRANIAFAGLKDKHALTTQHMTIYGGPRRGWSESNLAVDYLGQVARELVRDRVARECLGQERHPAGVSHGGRHRNVGGPRADAVFR